MTGQLSFDDCDDFDPAAGLDRGEWSICAEWCLAHPEATRWICRETGRINREECRPVSMRLDIEPTLKRRAREWGLDGGQFTGLDHNHTARLARYLMATRLGLKFRLRARVGDRVKNATPECAR